MERYTEAQERTYKKGDIIYRQGDMDLSIYDILWGRVAVYVDYGTENETLLTEVGSEGFLGMVGFLESRPQNTTAVALEKTTVAIITETSLLCFPALANLSTGRMSQRKCGMTGRLGKGRVKMREEWVVAVMMPMSQERPTMAMQARQLMRVE